MMPPMMTIKTKPSPEDVLRHDEYSRACAVAHSSVRMFHESLVTTVDLTSERSSAASNVIVLPFACIRV